EAVTNSVTETANAIEEMTRSVKGFQGNTEEIATAAEQTSSSITKMAASIEQVSAAAENLASSVEEVVASMEQLAKSVESVRRNSERITEEAAVAVTASTQLDRSIKSVGGMTKQAKDVSGRMAREAEDGGATVQRSIQGLSRIRESMDQS